MGTWSPDSFGNDDACDWSYALNRSPDFSLIEAALDAVLSAGQRYLEAPEAAQAIAAAEVLARLLGKWGKRDAHTAVADKWVETVKLTPSAALILKARQALDRVRTEPSELLELWEDSAEFAAWEKNVQHLKSRLMS